MLCSSFVSFHHGSNLNMDPMFRAFGKQTCQFGGQVVREKALKACAMID